MADLDFKQIGLAAKDIILGVGTAAAGAKGGPAAAEGVGKAGSGIDRILGMAGVMETRADKFDRADFSTQPRPAKPTQATPSKESQPPALPSAEAIEPPPSRAGSESPIIGDAKISVDHLWSLGWSRDKI